MTDESIYLIDEALKTHSNTVSGTHGFDAAGKVPPQAHGSSGHTGNIGTESEITFGATGGHAHTGSDAKVVAWASIASKPTLVSTFTNDSGFITGYCSYCTYCTFCTYCSYCTYCDCDCDCYCCK